MAEEPINATTPPSDRQVLRVGAVVSTPAALRLMLKNCVDPLQLLSRHCNGDWSDMGAEDRKVNALALIHHHRVFASYKLNETDRIWVITEADRSMTTFLLPSEY